MRSIANLALPTDAQGLIVPAARGRTRRRRWHVVGRKQSLGRVLLNRLFSGEAVQAGRIYGRGRRDAERQR